MVVRHPITTRKSPPPEVQEEVRQTTEGPVPSFSVPPERSLAGRLVRLELFLSIAIIGFGFFSWTVLKRQNTLQQVSLAQSRSLQDLSTYVASSGTKIAGLMTSVHDATGALANSASRINEFSDEFREHQNEMQALYARLHGVEIAVQKNQPLAQQPSSPHPPQTINQRPSLSSPASPLNPHTHEIDMSIPLPDGCIAHHNSQQETDYWLAPRMLPSGERLVKVQPYGVNSLGVKVHDIDDGMDYILSPEGHWLEGLERP
jgi:hypothetical protein